MQGSVLAEAEVFDFEARNPKPKFRVGKIGDVFSVDLEIDEELWNTLKLIPRGAMLKGKLFWCSEDDTHSEQATKAVTRKPPVVTPAGRFWQIMCAKGVLNNLDLCDVLEVNGPQYTKKAMYQHFGVDSLSKIDPQEFIGFCERSGLNALLMMAEQVLRELEERKQ